ncbi:MAG: hypothetical protein HC802_22770 [Caldilineaceae bacterium]|nr:hypothetical protein [Caldilineaceae bacterium]
MSRVAQLEVLEEVYQEGLDQVLENLLQFKREDYRRSLVEYDEILNRFEKQYGMESADAYRKFEAGKLGDSTDFFEWTGIYELRQYVLERIARIETVL